MTPTQQVVLRILAGRGCECAYRLGSKIPTLEALERRGFVRSDRSNPGCFYSPRTAIDWCITDAGRDAVRARVHGQSQQEKS